MYLPLDSPERLNWLDTISRNMDRKLQTDWPVVSSCNKSAELTDDERESVFEVMADGFLTDLVTRFNPMCFASTPALPPIPAAPPRLPDEGIRLVRADELSRRRRAAGRASTILTGPGGVTSSANTTGNTLLGQ
jgi:hypothetical protein